MRKLSSPQLCWLRFFLNIVFIGATRATFLPSASLIDASFCARRSNNCTLDFFAQTSSPVPRICPCRRITSLLGDSSASVHKVSLSAHSSITWLLSADNKKAKNPVKNDAKARHIPCSFSRSIVTTLFHATSLTLDSSSGLRGDIISFQGSSLSFLCRTRQKNK